SAEITSSTRPLCDGQSDSIADFASGHSLTEGNDLTHTLVPEHHGELAKFDRASSEQRVGVAHSARMDLDEDLVGLRLRHGYVLQHPRAVHVAHDCSFHRCHRRSSCLLSASAMSLASRACAASLTSLLSSALSRTKKDHTTCSARIRDSREQSSGKNSQ